MRAARSSRRRMMRSWREKRSTACTERSASSRQLPPHDALVIERGKFRESIYPSPRMIVEEEDDEAAHRVCHGGRRPASHRRGCGFWVSPARGALPVPPRCARRGGGGGKPGFRQSKPSRGIGGREGVG